MAKSITVQPRGDDYHASLDGTEQKVWGRGPTVKAAIGDLVLSHPERFGVTVSIAEPDEEDAA